MADKKEEKKIEPKYEWVEEDGAQFIAPVKRKINKTMEITESFTYYDALAYCMKMEKAIEDKRAEIQGLEGMVNAYREELELIEKELGVTKEEEEFQLELHEQKKKERDESEKAVESPYVPDDKGDQEVAS